MSQVSNDPYWVFSHGVDWAIVREGESQVWICLGHRGCAETIARTFAGSAANVIVLPEDDEVSRRAFCNARPSVSRV